MTKLPNGDDGPIDVYLREVASVPALTSEAEIELARRMAAGGDDGEIAKKDLVETHLRLVVDIAREYSGRGVHVLDLIQVGNVALLRSVEKYHSESGGRFADHAEPWIRDAIDARLRLA